MKRVLPLLIMCPPFDSNIVGDLLAEDDDGVEIMSWALPTGRKSRAKIRKPRAWYYDNKMCLEEQLFLKMHFADVYQFRRAVRLCTLHI